MHPAPDDSAGPTAERLAKTLGDFDLTGRSRSSRRYSMLDDPLGRAWKRQKISAEEYWALKRYAHHWTSGGLQGAIQSLDLDRIFAFDPSSMSGLAKTERQQDHRDAYRAARCAIGFRPAFVADQIACYGSSPIEVGMMLGYRSVWHGRDAAQRILGDAGHRLQRFWRDRHRYGGRG